MKLKKVNKRSFMVSQRGRGISMAKGRRVILDDILYKYAPKG